MKAYAWAVVALAACVASSACGWVGLEDGLEGQAGAVGSGAASSGGTPGAGAAGGTLGTGGAVTGGMPPTCPGCDPEKLLAYYDFESGVPDTSYEKNGGSLQTTDEIVHGGKLALQVSQGKSEFGQPSAMVVSQFEPLFEGDLFVRAWVYFPKEIVNGQMKLIGINNVHQLSVDINTGVSGFIEMFSHITREAHESPERVRPDGQWFCLQVETRIDDREGRVRAWIDGTEVLRVDNFATLPPAGINQVTFGLPWAGFGQFGAVVYFDDVVVALEPIDCSL